MYKAERKIKRYIYFTAGIATDVPIVLGEHMLGMRGEVVVIKIS